MFWFVNIAILLLGYAANKAIAGWLAQRQKPGLPGPFQLPTVPAGQGWIVTYGTTRGPGMCTWFQGAKLVELNLSSIDNITRIGSRRTVAYMYKVTAQIVLGIGPINEIRNIIFGDTRSLIDEPLTQLYDYGDGVINTVTRGPTGVSDDGALSVVTLFVPNAFGGKGRGGGLTANGGDRNDPFGGFLRFHRGRRLGNDVPDAVMEEYLGVGKVPVYGDLAYLVLDDVNVGESTGMPALEFVTYREPRPENIPGGGIGGLAVNEFTVHGRYSDMTVTTLSPVVIAFDILVNPLVGLDVSRSTILQGGLGSGYNGTFEAAHRRLQSEGIGMCMRFQGTRDNVEAALAEIERTVDGHIDRDPYSFNWTFRLNRDEAGEMGIDALPLFDKKTVVSVTLNKPLWEETYNEVTVEFLDAANNFKLSTETVQNAANIAMTRGLRPLPNVQYHSVVERSLARKLGARDLKKVSIPLWKGEIKVTRAAWSLVKGQVFRLTYDHKYPEVTNMLFRVASIDFGEETDNEITVQAVQDVFSFADIQRPTELPSGPGRQSAIVRPLVTKQTGTVVGSLGTATITLEDSERRGYEIAFRTQSGDAAPSAWNVVATASPNTSDPNFPFANPATDADLNGDHSYAVAVVSTVTSIVEYRIRYLGVGTVADPYQSKGELTGFVSFDGTAPTVSDIDPDPLVEDDGMGGYEIVFDADGNVMYA